MLTLKWKLFFWVNIFTMVAHAQNQLTGRIVDFESKRSIKNVIVINPQKNTITSTNANGYF